MNEELIVGLLATGIPLFAVGYLMLRRNAGIFRMFMAMLLIGLAYLTATGAMNDIGARVLGHKDAMTPTEEPASAPAPAAEKAAPPAEKAAEPAPAAPAPATP